MAITSCRLVSGERELPRFKKWITIDTGTNTMLGDESKKPEVAYAEVDELVAAEACRILAKDDPDLMFVYFGNVDEYGHLYGFQPKVPKYMSALETVDSHIGKVLEAMKARASYSQEDWLVIVCTDHGGQGTNHSGGHDDPEVNRIFLVVSRPTAVRGRIETATAQVDVAPTAFAHLGVTIDPAWK